MRLLFDKMSWRVLSFVCLECVLYSLAVLFLTTNVHVHVNVHPTTSSTCNSTVHSLNEDVCWCVLRVAYGIVLLTNVTVFMLVTSKSTSSTTTSKDREISTDSGNGTCNGVCSERGRLSMRGLDSGNGTDGMGIALGSLAPISVLLLLHQLRPHYGNGNDNGNDRDQLERVLVYCLVVGMLGISFASTALYNLWTTRNSTTNSGNDKNSRMSSTQILTIFAIGILWFTYSLFKNATTDHHHNDNFDNDQRNNQYNQNNHQQLILVITITAIFYFTMALLLHLYDHSYKDSCLISYLTSSSKASVSFSTLTLTTSISTTPTPTTTLQTSIFQKVFTLGEYIAITSFIAILLTEYIVQYIMPYIINTTTTTFNDDNFLVSYGYIIVSHCGLVGCFIGCFIPIHFPIYYIQKVINRFKQLFRKNKNNKDDNINNNNNNNIAIIACIIRIIVVITLILIAIQIALNYKFCSSRTSCSSFYDDNNDKFKFTSFSSRKDTNYMCGNDNNNDNDNNIKERNPYWCYIDTSSDVVGIDIDTIDIDTDIIDIDMGSYDNDKNTRSNRPIRTRIGTTIPIPIAILWLYDFLITSEYEYVDGRHSDYEFLVSKSTSRNVNLKRNIENKDEYNEYHHTRYAGIHSHEHENEHEHEYSYTATTTTREYIKSLPRYIWLLYWLLVLICTLPIAIMIAQKLHSQQSESHSLQQSESETQNHSQQQQQQQQRNKKMIVIARKYFHFIGILLFSPVTYFAPSMMFLSYSIATAFLTLGEALRCTYHKYNMTSSSISTSSSLIPSTTQHKQSNESSTFTIKDFFQTFFDEKDIGASNGGFVFTHIALIIGCAVPLWFHHLLSIMYQNNTIVNESVSASTCVSASTSTCSTHEHMNIYIRFTSTLSIMPYLGIIILGIGDAVGAIYGSCYGRRNWPKSKRTIEGSIAMIVSMVISSFILRFILRFENDNGNDNDENDLTISFDILVKEFVLIWIPVGLMEAVTLQIDNLCLPLFAIAMCGCCSSVLYK